MTCKVCGKEHGSLVCEPVLQLSAEIRKENGERETRLRAKCRWEQMFRSRVLKEYGDPGFWHTGDAGEG